MPVEVDVVERAHAHRRLLVVHALLCRLEERELVEVVGADGVADRDARARRVTRDELHEAIRHKGHGRRVEAGDDDEIVVNFLGANTLDIKENYDDLIALVIRTFGPFARLMYRIEYRH